MTEKNVNVAVGLQYLCFFVDFRLGEISEAPFPAFIFFRDFVIIRGIFH